MRSRELVSLVVVVILVVVSALGALKFKRERDAMRATLTKYAAAVPITMVGAAGAPAPERLRDMVRKARDFVAQGRYALADEQLQRLARQAPVPAQRVDTEPEEDAQAQPVRRQRGPSERAFRQPLGPGPGGRGRRVSPEGHEFFESHPELNRRAQALAGAIMARRRQGADVREAQQFLREAIEAAERGDEAKVEQLVRRTERALGGAPEAPAAERERRQRPPAGGAPRALQQRWAQFREAVREAEAQGKDTRPVAELMPRLREAIQKRDARRAEQLLEEGTARLRRAKPSAQRTSQRTRRGAPRGGPRRPSSARGQQPAEMAAARRFIQMLTATMTQEQESLNQVRRSIANAELALREKNQEQVREILQTATVELARIEGGRQALVKLAQQGPRRPSEPAGRERARGPASLALDRPLPVPFVKPREAVGQIGGAFDKVRTLTDDEYGSEKQKLALALLECVFVLPEVAEKQPEEEAAAGAPVTEAVVRQKLESAEEPYREAKAADAERAQEAQRLLAEVRRLLHKAKYNEANEALDRALTLLGVAAPQPAAGSTSERPRREEREEQPPS